MTEHSKSQPRIFDELGSSHEIVHQGDRQAIAAGITVVNIAATFISPLLEEQDFLDIKRKQPHAAERMIDHFGAAFPSAIPLTPLASTLTRRLSLTATTEARRCRNFTRAPSWRARSLRYLIQRIADCYVRRFA